MARRAQSARAAGTVSIAVLMSRILGLVREQVFAHFFGAGSGIYSDAWRVAFRIPNLLRDLFAEGALSSAFVPTFTEHMHKKGREEAWLLANLVINALLVLVGLFTLALLLFPDAFVFLMAQGFAKTPGKVELTVSLVRILSPFLLFVALASVAMGILNTLNRFFLPALAPALFNLASIGAFLFLIPAFRLWEIEPIYAMAAGALLGGLLQLGVQLPILFREGFRYRPRFNLQHAGLRKIARLIMPAVVGISAVQLNVLVNTQLASQLGYNGPLSWLECAFRILYLPIGLFGVAVGVVNLREVSVYAAQEKWDEFKETVANSLKLVSLVAIPSTIGLMVLAKPIVRLLFEHGRFTPADTAWTAYALMAYSIGLIAYSCVKIYVPSFYALNDTRTPVRISLTAVGVNITINLTLMVLLPLEYKYLGLAFGTSASVLLNNTLLARSFRKRLGSLAPLGVHRALGKNAVAAVAMGSVIYALNEWLTRLLPEVWWSEVMALSMTIGAGAAVYFAVCHLLHVEEVRMLMNRIGRLRR